MIYKWAGRSFIFLGVFFFSPSPRYSVCPPCLFCESQPLRPLYLVLSTLVLYPSTFFPLPSLDPNPSLSSLGPLPHPRCPLRYAVQPFEPVLQPGVQELPHHSAWHHPLQFHPRESVLGCVWWCCGLCQGFWNVPRNVELSLTAAPASFLPLSLHVKETPGSKKPLCALTPSKSLYPLSLSDTRMHPLSLWSQHT